MAHSLHVEYSPFMMKQLYAPALLQQSLSCMCCSNPISTKKSLLLRLSTPVSMLFFQLEINSMTIANKISPKPYL